MDSKHKAAGSENSFPEKKMEFVRSAHIFNCSLAAALKVSAATTPTFFFFNKNLFAIFPTVAVFPAPLTPTTKMICKGEKNLLLVSRGFKISVNISLIKVLILSDEVSISFFDFNFLATSAENFTPRSDDISSSSNSSTTFSSIFFPFIMVLIPAEILFDDFDNPFFNFLTHPKTIKRLLSKSFHYYLKFSLR